MANFDDYVLYEYNNSYQYQYKNPYVDNFSFENFEYLNNKNEICEVYNYFFYFLISTLFFFASIFIPIVFVSYCLYKPMINDFVLAYKNNNKLYEYDNFLFEYLDEYNELEDKDLDEEYLKLLKNKYIIYNTSYGDIILYYSFDNSSFNYYAKSSNLIPFNYIDVVSRIYVCEYDCKKIYIDNYDNILKDEDESDESDESDQDKDKKNGDQKSSIFYSNPKTKSVEKSNIENYISNKYKYEGTINEFKKKYKNALIIKSNSESYLINDISNCLDTTFTLYKQKKNDINLSDLCNNDLKNYVSKVMTDINNDNYQIYSDYESDTELDNKKLSFKDFKNMNN